MADLLLYVFLLALLAVGVVAGVWLLRGYMGGNSPANGLFGPRAEKRLGIVEHANIDGRRRLVLLRRDGVEHLIMTGGPVDVVIETGIGPSRTAIASVATTADDEAAHTPSSVGTARVFGRAPRTLGRPAQPVAE